MYNWITLMSTWNQHIVSTIRQYRIKVKRKKREANQCPPVLLRTPPSAFESKQNYSCFDYQMALIIQ